MKAYRIIIKNFTIAILSLYLFSCSSEPSGKKLHELDEDLTSVADSISQLMRAYHYNPEELDTDEYLQLEKKLENLARTVDTREGFINGFNELWKDGPFSHVRLTNIDRPAEDMAEFIDAMQVGEHAVSLKWSDRTAVLTVTTMTGVDTKGQIFEAYREIASNDTESLILDLRNNNGGTFAGIPLVGHLLQDSIDAGVFVSQKWWTNHDKAPNLLDAQDISPWYGWSIKSFWNDVQEQALTRIKFAPMDPHFDGPTYVLISNKTASAAEFTVDALAQKESITIIGKTTAGEMLSQKMFDLPHGYQMSLPIADYYSHRIGRIEGKGVDPEIAIDQIVALDLALSLTRGENLEDAMKNAQKVLDELERQPLGEPIYLLGSMNEWGNEPDLTPKFEFIGNGVYRTTTTLRKGKYEFKIAPKNWSFDFGINSDEQKIIIGKTISVKRESGSSNLMMDIEEESSLIFELILTDEKAAKLLITKN